MPWNGSGTASSASGNPAVPGTTILSSLYNDTVNDIVNMLNNVVTRDAQGVMSAQFKLINGTVSVPGLGFNSETSTGIYLPGLTLGLAVTSQGVEVARFKTSGNVLIGTTTDTGERLQVTGTAKVTSNTTVGGTLGVTGATTLSSTLGVTGAATLSSTLAVTGATTLSSTLAVTGTPTFSATPIINGASFAQLEFRENDQTLPAGRWRWTLDGDQFALRHNTAVAGDFSSYVSPISFSTTNNTSVSGILSVAGATALSSTLAVTGATTLSSTLGVTGATTLGGTLGVTGTTTLAGLSATTGSFSSTLAVTGAATLGTANVDLLKVQDGTATAPSITFTSDTNTGIYRVGENQLGICAAGGLRLTVGNTSMVSAGPVLLPDGTAAAPSLTFSSDTNTGLYWVSANVLGITTNGTLAASFDATGNASIVGSVTIGNDLAFTGTSSGIYSTADTGYTCMSGGSSISVGANVLCYGSTHATLPTIGRLRANTANPLEWGTGYIYIEGTTYINSSSVGSYTPNASGDDLVVDHGVSGGMSLLTSTAGTSYIMFGDTADSFIGGIRYTHTDDTLSLFAGNVYPLSLSATDAVFASGVDAVLNSTTGPSSTTSMGFRGVPQNSRSANYTLVLSDAGKHIYHPLADTAGRTFTIPANASVAFPIGTVVSFVNMDTAACTIAITTDTMYLAGTGSTGSRTLAQFGIATAIKTGSTEWLISGTNLT